MMTTIRQSLDKNLRRVLEATVIKARDISEQAATQALKQLGVGDAKPADYLSDVQRKLRTRLRAHGRQLGDIKSDNGQQTTHKLVTEVAYGHWHRMLFARFLEQNGLLMYDEYTKLTLADCNELVQAPDTARDDLERSCTSGWELAGVLASKMLPQIFRIDSPVFELEFAPEHQRSLEQLVTGLDTETFQAQDSLGWVYQFWQSKRKEEVNKSEVKIGADELSPVTQLFTEPYMVSFLLDNSLGAWWAGQQLTDSDWQNATSEQELRDKATIPGVPLSYLRFVKDDLQDVGSADISGANIGETTQQWQPASGTFDTLPKQLSELKIIDPCCGSGHFLVAAFLMLVPMHMQAESLTAKQAIDIVLSENLYGLELDQRCVELAAFTLALEAWRYPDADGFRMLPEMNIACSGLSISAKKEEWLTLAGENTDLQMALEELYKQFKDAAVLGSLINPAASLGRDSLFELKWEEVGPLLTQALQGEENDEKNEMGVVAKGIAKASVLLTQKYSFAITNVPYLGQKKYSNVIRDHVQQYYEESKSDLALVFTSRIHHLLCEGGASSLVLPQGWLFQSNDLSFREKTLKKNDIKFVCTLGANSFTTPIGAQVMLLVMKAKVNEQENFIKFSDASMMKGWEEKSLIIKSSSLAKRSQSEIFTSDRKEINVFTTNGETIGDYADSLQGLSTGEKNLFERYFWEFSSLIGSGWEYLHETSASSQFIGGRCSVILWENESGRLAKLADSLKHLNHSVQSWRRGKPYWNKKGIAVNRMGSLHRSLYSGDKFSVDIGVISPHCEKYFMALYAFCMSEEFVPAVRNLYSKPEVPMSYLVNIPFNFEKWSVLSDRLFPKGLPEIYTSEITQWVFHGHPCGSVIWDEDSKWTTAGELRVDDSVLQVAVARLLGYRWPAELDTEMELAVEQRALVEKCQELSAFVDDDGIVCLPAVRGEKAADQRLEALLQAAYGEAWTTPLKNRLLETVGSKSLSLWLRDKFFEQHCKMFQHRPFIWHTWDGLNDGFSALINYHTLDKAGLERLIYTYLGDWIRTQEAGMSAGEDGAQERLAAAETLKAELEAILKGEAPYDIFVRWKGLAEQPIGWTPDLNDGVRLNIRPFLKARDVAKKDTGILRWKPSIKWTKDRGKDVESAPWYNLGLQYDEGEGARINDHHLSLEEKKVARFNHHD